MRTYSNPMIHLLILASFLIMSAPIIAQDSTDVAVQEKEHAGKDHFAVLSEGPRTEEEIQEVTERYHKTLVHYYLRELRTNPGLEGIIKVRLKIRSDGSVLKATVLENSVGSGTLARSVQKHCLKWQFKHMSSDAHTHTVELELPFEPPADP